jgi:Zn-dependent oligopeptidase
MKTLRAGLAALVASLVVWALAPALPAADAIDTTPFYASIADPDSLTKSLGAHLAAAQAKLDQLVAMKGKRTVDNTLRPYDEAEFEMSQAEGPANVVARTHPDERMRDAAEAVLLRARTLGTQKLSNRAVYDALTAIDTNGIDPQVRYYLARERDDFRRNGIDKDAATLAAINDLQEKLGTAQTEFRRNIGNTTHTITLDSAADLDGMPADFIARQKPGVTGAITMRVDNSNYPVMLFAKREEPRKRFFMEYANIAYPENLEILNRMLALRWDLAHRFGFETWAAYDSSSRMVGTAKAASDFVDRAMQAAKPRAAREYQEILKRKQQDVPGATAINAWEFEYYRELVRKASYDFDSQAVRPYFPYERVKQGVMDVTSRLYGITYRPAPTVKVWHPSVEVFDVLDGDRLVGRLYLDTQARPNKQVAGGSAATSVAHGGFAGHQIPEVIIQANIPGGQPGDPRLLTYQLVRDPMFHEFGHAMDRIMGGAPRWYGLREEAEDDFREVIPQLFEEWAWNPSVIVTFAKHYQTNEPIPAALVEKMRRASEFSKGMGTAGQLAFARLVLALHDRDPKTVDQNALYRDIFTADAPWLYTDGIHRQLSISQLANSNYASGYYGYYWALVIAKDLFGQFDETNLLAPGPAHRLRDAIMKPGGIKPAADMVRDFLGRPYTEKAWSVWLNKEPS